MLDTLYAKTFLILGTQLTLTWLCTVMLTRVFRNYFFERMARTSDGSETGQALAADQVWATIKPYFWSLLAADFIVFAMLHFFGTGNLFLGIPLFSLWSVLTGAGLALSLMTVDERLVGRVLALTALITYLAGLAGARAAIDFSVFGSVLFYALLLLVIFGLVRVFFAIPRWLQRLWALFGAVVFTGYLLFDFHRLGELGQQVEANTWPTAMRMAIRIYLDIVNLFLMLLDLLAK